MRMKILLCLSILIGVCLRDPSSAMRDEPDSHPLARKAQVSIHALGPDKPFSYYYLRLSTEEAKSLKNTKVGSTAEYNNYSHLDTLTDDVRNFIVSLGNDEKTSTNVSSTVIRIVKGLVQASGQETAWVALRSFTPMSEYDTLRGHTDGHYFEPYEGDPYKFALSLKGAPTLFFTPPLETKKGFLTYEMRAQKKIIIIERKLLNF